METTIVRTSDVTIYIHEDACDAEMNTAVQEVAGIIFDISVTILSEGLPASLLVP